MEWVALGIWLLVVGLALPMAGAGGLTAASLGIAPPLTIAGLVLCVLYVATNGGRWMAWASVGCAAAAAVVVALGSRVLVSDDPRTGSAGQTAEEHAATLAGIEFPLLVTTTFLMTLAGAGITTIS